MDSEFINLINNQTSEKGRNFELLFLDTFLLICYLGVLFVGWYFRDTIDENLQAIKLAISKKFIFNPDKISEMIDYRGYNDLELKHEEYYEKYLEKEAEIRIFLNFHGEKLSVKGNLKFWIKKEIGVLTVYCMTADRMKILYLNDKKIENIWQQSGAVFFDKRYLKVGENSLDFAVDIENFYDLNIGLRRSEGEYVYLDPFMNGWTHICPSFDLPYFKYKIYIFPESTMTCQFYKTEILDETQIEENKKRFRSDSTKSEGYQLLNEDFNSSLSLEGFLFLDNDLIQRGHRYKLTFRESYTFNIFYEKIGLEDFRDKSFIKEFEWKIILLMKCYWNCFPHNYQIYQYNIFFLKNVKEPAIMKSNFIFPLDVEYFLEQGLSYDFMLITEFIKYLFIQDHPITEHNSLESVLNYIYSMNLLQNHAIKLVLSLPESNFNKEEILGHLLYLRTMKLDVPIFLERQLKKEFISTEILSYEFRTYHNVLSYIPEHDILDSGVVSLLVENGLKKEGSHLFQNITFSNLRILFNNQGKKKVEFLNRGKGSSYMGAVSINFATSYKILHDTIEEMKDTESEDYLMSLDSNLHVYYQYFDDLREIDYAEDLTIFERRCFLKMVLDHIVARRINILSALKTIFSLLNLEENQKYFEFCTVNVLDLILLRQNCEKFLFKVDNLIQVRNKKIKILTSNKNLLKMDLKNFEMEPLQIEKIFDSIQNYPLMLTIQNFTEIVGHVLGKCTVKESLFKTSKNYPAYKLYSRRRGLAFFKKKLKFKMK